MVKKYKSEKLDIYYDTHADNKVPVIIVSHGFRGWKDWGFFPFVCEQLAMKGAIVFCHNFTMNGNPDNTGFFTNTEKFANNTISTEVQDLKVLIDDIKSGKIKAFEKMSNFWNGEIYLAGHSLGAGISLIVGQKQDIVKKIALWASIGKFIRFTKRQIELWKKEGYFEFNNTATNQMLRMNYCYIEDLITHTNEYDLPSIIENSHKPILIIHGEQDVTVPKKEIELLIKNDKNKMITYESVEKIGHSFGVEHPFNGNNQYLEKLIKISSEFLCL
jgi:dienelactone hydrolase